LLFWITRKAGGLGPVLRTPSKFHSSTDFMRFFIPSLTGMVGFWATVALNIPDFTRYAKSQRAQIVGQALGLPTAMTLYSFIGVAVTSASAVIFGEAIWDPVVLLGRFNQPVVALIALVALLLATLNTNVAANVVSPSNDFSNLRPSLISFRTGGLITGVVGILMMPWKLLRDFSSYIFGWLVGCSALLGPIAGIMICDYYLLRHRNLVVEDLYRRCGAYEYQRGFNPKAIVALVAGVTVAVDRAHGAGSALALRLRLVCRLPHFRRIIFFIDAAPSLRIEVVRGMSPWKTRADPLTKSGEPPRLIPPRHHGLWLTANANNTAKPKSINPAAIKINICCRPTRLPDTNTSSSSEMKLTRAFL